MNSKSSPNLTKDASRASRERKSGGAAPAYKAKFTPNTRDKADRREGTDRREQIRFEEGRRTGKDRRPAKSWAPGKNI